MVFKEGYSFIGDAITTGLTVYHLVCISFLMNELFSVYSDGHYSMFTARFNYTRDGVASSTGSVYLSGAPCLFSMMEIEVFYEICQLKCFCLRL